jgi:3-hydroxyisobutyryl-CoA hydrolase
MTTSSSEESPQSPKKSSEEEPDVIFEQQGGDRTILLNRPKKLNSLNLSMIQKILPRLKVFHNT